MLSRTSSHNIVSARYEAAKLKDSFCITFILTDEDYSEVRHDAYFNDEGIFLEIARGLGCEV